MNSGTGNTTSLVLGFPIRTSSDQRSVDSSPRHNAASHVLHRPLMPRHPPCALKHLQHKKPQSGSSALIQETQNYTTTNQQQPHPTKGNGILASLMLATTIHESNTTPHHQVERHPDSPPPPHSGMTHPHRFPRRDEVKTGLLPQSPTVCLADLTTTHPIPSGRGRRRSF